MERMERHKTPNNPADDPAVAAVMLHSLLRNIDGQLCPKTDPMDKLTLDLGIPPNAVWNALQILNGEDLVGYSVSIDNSGRRELRSVFLLDNSPES